MDINILMEPKHLEEDELQFELRLRSMPSVLTRGRVDALRERLASEDRNEIQPPAPLISNDVESHVSSCSNKLECIGRLVLIAAESECEESLEILPSRLIHVLGRLNRLISGDHRITEQVDSLKRKAKSYLKMLLEAREGITNLKDGVKDLQSLSLHVLDSGANLGANRSGSKSFAQSTPLSSVNVNALGAKAKNPVDPRSFLPLPRDRINYIEHPRKTSSPIIGDSTKDDGGEQLSDLFEMIDLDRKTSNTEIATIIKDYQTFLKNKPISRPIDRVDKTSHNRPMLNTNRNTDALYPENRNKLTNKNNDPAQSFFNEDYRQNKINKENAGQTPFHTPTNQYRNPEPIAEVERNPSNNFRQRNPVPNWNLKFSGDGKGLDVHEFLAQVSLMARADRVSNNELVASAIHLFTGPARTWYLAFESLFNTWEELTNELRGAFVSEDSDFIILKEIEQRRQGKEETFVLYLSSLLNMFKYLQEPLTERKKVSLVMRNMSPFLADRLALVEIRDTYHLATLCKKIEDVRNRSRSFRQNPEEPVIQNPPRKNRVYEIDSRPQTPPRKVSFQSQEFCWNCKEKGHVFQNCTQPKMRVFCYTCGEVGQLANQCNSCNPKNDQRRPDFRRRDNGKN